MVPDPCPFVGCEGAPVAATVAAWQGGRIVATTSTDRVGRYGMDLRPGKYELVAYPWARHIHCEPVAVYIPGGKHVRADIGCRIGLPTPGPADSAAKGGPGG